MWMATGVRYANKPSAAETRPASRDTFIRSTLQSGRNWKVYYISNYHHFKGIIVSVFIDKDEEEREKIRRSVRDQAGVDTEDLLFPSPSGSSISQGTKRKVCYTYTLHIFGTLFWGHNILFSRRNLNFISSIKL